MITFGLFQLASLRSVAVALQSISTTWPTRHPSPPSAKPKNATQPPVLSTTSTFSRPKSVFFIFLRCEPLGGRVQGGGRFRLLAAGGSDIRDASPVLLEPDACDWSGGPITGRVHRAPGYQNRQGHRCAASASSQAHPPGPGPQAASPQRHQTKKTDISNPGVGRDIGSKAGGLFPACYRFKTCF
ncbi:Uncharacterised protein [Alcaligenes faecalis]|nr:hypothetical protein AFA2_03579 [Alcaligenes faecalis subsp. faecalis NBRC 13111]CUI84935.1 Uncharacterised protein [Alcaligenes faecalis]